ncbi:hypothetical protein Tco_1003416 [Tanacetum coccineum]|uniref:Uncharacterized protein n=1 Tax=Tanacetum coccineum TaxID=301880 RepID=A0ABQ5FAH9_9ASTR
MENPNSPNEPNEATPEVNPVIPEPNHVEDAHDPNEMSRNAVSKRMVKIDIEMRDVEIKDDDDADWIFPYERGGLAWARMERDTAERSLHESTGWNRRFYWEMVLKGAVPKPPSDDEDDGRPRKKSKKSDRDDGPSEPRGPPSDS